MKKTCLHRLNRQSFCGNCKTCKEDYEPRTPDHPFNNYDCKDYYEIGILTTNTIVVDFNIIDRMCVGFGHMFGRNGDLKKELLEKKAKEIGGVVQ